MYTFGESRMSINKSTLSTLSRRPSLIIHIVALLVSAGFGFYHLVYDVKLIGITAAFSALFCAKTIINLFRNNPRAVDYYFFYGFQFVALITTCYIYGLRGLILIYPITASLFYVLAYRVAFWSAFGYFIFAIAASAQHFEPDMMFRIAVALSTSVIISAGFSFVVYRQQSLLEYEANHDYLTNILNRRGFSSRLAHLLEKKKKLQEDAAVLFIDLDGFKGINDTYGHETGDKLLAAFAARITGSLRSHNLGADEDGANSFARISGDEFVLTLSDIDATEARNIAERLIKVCEKPFNILDNKIQISMSIGICFASQANHEVQSLLNKADAAMYLAKQSGKAGFAFHQDEPGQ